ncbi:hypothetical protein SAMD00019534_096870 [Acytostelium subglobosum LB1]|uniref:hypothetical protein n=1 Tax=Acytostelium subglobosum LB1 TaxID=1410327 RepID=UPI000644E5E7|nr:hypothetical protein SAMD00019534_096870 [Acytostelium subglobosum LB1]GAM26512.1 hypothetical protein SAMD00019534_096870 [Acytostelium subglobosum LB1]|eukprot:XP_012750608.1 hypothetical protein SAMD00019534_096870 [Acytostelium subglobosum LB1]
MTQHASAIVDEASANNPLCTMSTALAPASASATSTTTNMFDDDSFVNYFLSEDLVNKIDTCYDMSFEPGESMVVPNHHHQHSAMHHDSSASSSSSSPEHSCFIDNTTNYFDPSQTHSFMVNTQPMDDITTSSDCSIQIDAQQYCLGDTKIKVENDMAMSPFADVPSGASSTVTSPEQPIDMSSASSSSPSILRDCDVDFSSVSSPSTDFSSDSQQLMTYPSSSVAGGSATSGSTKQKKRPSWQQGLQNLVHPLTRDELLKLTGKEPVEVNENTGDERTVKKQRRLVKNRESAQLSRMRKKIYIEDLEKKISDLTSENTDLRDEVLYLQSVMKQLATSNPDITKQLQQHESMRAKNAKAAGVCLLILIFSIGIFLNPQQPSQSQPSFTNSLATRRSIASVGEPSNSDLLSLALEEDTVEQDINTNEVYVPTSAVAVAIPPAATPTTSTSSTASKKRQHEPESPGLVTPTQQEKKRVRIIPSEEVDTVPPRLVSRESDDGTIPATPTEQQQRFDEFNAVASSGNLQDGPIHSSYIVCSERPRIISNNLTQTAESMFSSNPSAPLSIGLLIPSDSLGINLTSSTMSSGPQERSILEISCQVSNIRVWNPTSLNNNVEPSLFIHSGSS